MKKFFFLLFTQFFLYSQNSKNTDISVYDESVLNIIDLDSKIEILDSSFLVAEGPLWYPKKNQLIFSDVRQNKIFTWDENSGTVEYISPSGSTGYAPSFKEGGIGANGLAFDSKGNLILCQHGDRRLALLSNNKTNKPKFKTIIDNYKGKRFNSPNDLVINSEGDIFFTDPPYGFYYNRKSFDNKYREIGFNGVYKINRKKEIFLITDKMTLPNGIALSLDEKFLYVNNSGRDDPKIMRFDVENFEGEVFFNGEKLSKKYKGGFDGLKVHSSGNIFTSGPNGILIISPNGKLLATINFGKGVTNCSFDKNENYLYVTGFNDISRIKLK